MSRNNQTFQEKNFDKYAEALRRNLYHRKMNQRSLFKMGILSDKWIRKQAKENKMIDPFCEHLKQEGCLSYGLSSYGYDVRLADEFQVFSNTESNVIDPKNFPKSSLVSKKAEYCDIPPNGFVLGRTVERFRIPRDILVICVGKSTYARCGLIVNVTPLEPEWEGYVTLEFSNTTSLPLRIYANEGISQFLFFKGTEPCETSYLDRKGRYQNQEEITLPYVKKEG